MPPTAPTTQRQQQGIKPKQAARFVVGNVSVTVWEKQADGRMHRWVSAPQRSYTDGDGKAQFSDSLYEGDIANATICMNDALAFMRQQRATT